MNHKTIITELRRINAWRRGDETVGQPAPGHFGDVLDAAAILIEQTDARCIEREERIEQMGAAWDKTKADLARVTAANAKLSHELYEHRVSTDQYAKELAALRARNAEVVRELSHVADCSQNRDAENMLLQQRNTELVAALDDLLGCPTVTDLATCPNGDPSRIDEAPEWQAVLQISCAWTRYKKLKALARAGKTPSSSQSSKSR